MASNPVTDRGCPPHRHDSHNTHTIRYTCECAQVGVHPQAPAATRGRAHTGSHVHTQSVTSVAWAACRCAHTRGSLVGCTLTHTCVCISVTSMRRHHTNVGVQTRTCTPGSAPPHTWDTGRFSAHPSRCLRPPPPTAQLTCQTEGYQAPSENAGVFSVSRVFLSFPRDCILVLERGLN